MNFITEIAYMLPRYIDTIDTKESFVNSVNDTRPTTESGTLRPNKSHLKIINFCF